MPERVKGRATLNPFASHELSHDSRTHLLSTFACAKQRDKSMEITHEKELLLESQRVHTLR